MNFPKVNKVFQRPCRSVLLPPQRFATNVLNYYDRSIFSRAGSLGIDSQAIRKNRLRVPELK